ncbi:MAG: sigma 54-interacting transcriptional regulator [Rhodothermaceae bacterium]|nr:sigma 54-interacting transcriptional regulator [Rhodothermaceae bacterium]
MEDQKIEIPASLEALFEIALQINSIQEAETLLDRVLEIATTSIQADRGYILLSNEEKSDGFEVKSTFNLPNDQLGDIVNVSTSVVHRVLQTGDPVILYEAMEDKQFGLARSIVVQKIRSIACVPLRIKRRQIGAIYMDCLTDRGRFKQDNLPFLEAFSNLAAIAIENARFYNSLRAENSQLRKEIQQINGFDEIIGQSPAMRELFDVITRLLDNDASVLIHGESGTGKELVARAIHYNGHRKDKPFLAMFCGALPDTLLESELFGHKKGAFTGANTDKPGLFEVADGGTLFLDEVGDLSSSIQTALLRVLQEGEVKRVGETKVRHVDVRIVSASNKSLEDLIEEGVFREDLYYRLNTIPVSTPPLRDRIEDVPLLANFFLDKYAKGRRSHIKGFTHEAIEVMQGYHWPGNVRELQNTIERAVVMTSDDLIGKNDLKIKLPEKPLAHKYRKSAERGATLKHVERLVVEDALARNNGNVTRSAQELGVSRSWIHLRLKEWENSNP